MSKKYHEIMKHIEVTPLMHERILENLKQTDLNNSSRKTIVNFPIRKPLVALTICLIFIIFTSYSLHKSTSNSKLPDSSIVTSPVNGIIELSSKKELVEKIGFEVKELKNLPFQVTHTRYTIYWQSLAEISYLGEAQSAIYRQGLGNNDISGDYNNYKNIKEINIDNLSVTLKGNDSGYCLAIWTDGSYAYSISLSQEIDENCWKHLIKN